MKKAIHALLAFMLLLTFVIGCVGCDTNHTSDRLTLSKSTLQLKVGEQAEISATGISADTTVLWSSNNESVAIVSSSGNVVALSEGKAVITATALPEKSTATCTVTVTKAAETVSITLSKTRLEMFVGDSETLSAMVLPAGSNIKVAWSSSNAKSVTVKDGTVQAIAAGTSFIQAKAGDATAVCAVEVKEAFGSISGTITCYNKDAGKYGEYEVDVMTTLYLVPNDAREIDLKKILLGDSPDRDDIYYAQVDALGNYKFDNIKLGTYRMIIVSGDFRYYDINSSWIQKSAIPGRIIQALGDVWKRGTIESVNWINEIDEYYFYCPQVQGFNVNVGKAPLTIIRTFDGIGAGTDVL